MITALHEHDLVAGQPFQTGAVGVPVGGACGGNATVVVEVYALGAGVAVKGEGGDLGSAQGAFELEATGRCLVIDQRLARKAQWLVVPVEGDVAAVGQALEAVGHKSPAKFASGCVHGVSGSAKTAILSLPQGWGKTTIAHELAKRLGCAAIVDEWHPAMPVFAGALHLTSVEVAA